MSLDKNNILENLHLLRLERTQAQDSDSVASIDFAARLVVEHFEEKNKLSTHGGKKVALIDLDTCKKLALSTGNDSLVESLDIAIKAVGLYYHTAELTHEFAHPLESIFTECIDQLTKGKGERHGGESIPFLEQPWRRLAEIYGAGFLFGQSAKKAGEAMGKTGEARHRELLGAINYLAMGVLFESQQEA